jgi:hypothetical protein
MIFLWVPETAQRTLEELSQVFAVPTRKHMKYQFDTYLPWFFGHYFLRRDFKLEPLYHESKEVLIQEMMENQTPSQIDGDRELEHVEGIAPDNVIPKTVEEDAASVTSSASSTHN